MSPNRNNMKLTGRKILMGEYRVQIFVMIIKNRTPSLNILILLFPIFRASILTGIYFTLLPLLKTPNVSVVGYEYVLGSRYKKLRAIFDLTALNPDVRSETGNFATYDANKLYILLPAARPNEA